LNTIPSSAINGSKIRRYSLLGGENGCDEKGSQNEFAVVEEGKGNKAKYLVSLW
jgi:hypothetical protein